MARLHISFLDASEVLVQASAQLQNIPHDVWNHVLVLCTTLYTAFTNLYRRYGWDLRLGVSFLELPLKGTLSLNSNQWCPRERMVITELSDGNHCVLSLCSQLHRPRDPYHHRNCSPRICHALQVDPHTYKTKHVNEACECSMVSSEGVASFENISEILAGDSRRHMHNLVRSIPFMTFESGRLGVRNLPLMRAEVMNMRVVQRTKCIAFSHVWADGLGNHSANELPRCQLSRLQALANGIFPEDERPIPFWIDTLGIPINKSERKEALTRMDWIFKAVSRVLVIDQTLVNISTEGMSPEEICLRIMCSNWARRLWTLQEGSYQGLVRYQFANTNHSYRQLKERVRLKYATRIRSIVTRLDSDLMREQRAALLEIGNNDWFFYKSMSACWPSISNFFKGLDITYHQEFFSTHRGGLLLNRVIGATMGRTTSNDQDEPRIFLSLCVPTPSLGGYLDRGKDRTAFAHPWSSSNSDMQPRATYKDIFRGAYFSFVPSQMLFLNLPRYPQNGCRWIPTSFLSQNSSRYAGLEGLSYGLSDNAYGVPLNSGVTVRYPGYRLLRSSGVHRLAAEFRVLFGGLCYTAQVHEAGSEKFPEHFAARDLALVMPRRIHEAPDKLTGILVSIVDWNFETNYKQEHRAMIVDAWPLLRYPSDNLFRLVNSPLVGAELGSSQRILARHEALVDFQRLPARSFASDHLRLMHICRISEHDDDQGNNRWIIG